MAGGGNRLPVADTVVEEFQITLPEVADYLVGGWGLVGVGVLAGAGEEGGGEGGGTLPQEKQRTGMIIVRVGGRMGVEGGVWGLRWWLVRGWVWWRN